MAPYLRSSLRQLTLQCLGLILIAALFQACFAPHAKPDPIAAPTVIEPAPPEIAMRSPGTESFESIRDGVDPLGAVSVPVSQ